MSHRHATLDDTVYFWFASNNTSGSGADGATPAADVRLAGAADSAAPVLSPTPVLLSHANYPDVCHEVAVAATVANGFASGNSYAVFCTLAVDGQNPTGFVGSFRLAPVPAQVKGIDADAVTAAALAADAVAEIQSGLGTAANQSTLATAVDGIPAAVDTELTGNHGSGSWASSGGGSGSNAVVLTVTDTDDAPVESAAVRVTKGVESWVLQTDASGEADFSIDDGSWTVRINRQGYEQFTPVTLVVSGVTAETYELTALSLSAPDSPAQITGYAYCYDADGAAQSGVTVFIRMVKTPAGSTGHHYSYLAAELMSDEFGLIEHTGLFPGATYRIWREGNQSGADQFIIAADAVSPVAIPDSH
jgi:hypothetical protein